MKLKLRTMSCSLKTNPALLHIHLLSWFISGMVYKDTSSWNMHAAAITSDCIQLWQSIVWFLACGNWADVSVLYIKSKIYKYRAWLKLKNLCCCTLSWFWQTEYSHYYSHAQSQLNVVDRYCSNMHVSWTSVFVNHTRYTLAQRVNVQWCWMSFETAAQQMTYREALLLNLQELLTNYDFGC